MIVVATSRPSESQSSPCGRWLGLRSIVLSLVRFATSNISIVVPP